VTAKPSATTARWRSRSACIPGSIRPIQSARAETALEPETWQDVSIWGHTPEHQTIIDEFALVRTGTQPLLRTEDTVLALAGDGIRTTAQCGLGATIGV